MPDKAYAVTHSDAEWRQSHLTSIFRREIGMTPGRFRAELT